MWNINKNLYETPEITEINRIPMHGAEIPFAEVSDENLCNYEKSPYYMCLNGDWKFKLFRSVDNIPENVFKKNFNDTKYFHIMGCSLTADKKFGESIVALAEKLDKARADGAKKVLEKNKAIEERFNA